MPSFESVLCIAAAFCVSGRGALLLLVLLSLTTLFACVVQALWQWWGLAGAHVACVVSAVGVGGALWRCLSAVNPQNADDLGPLLPLLMLCLLCGLAATRPIWWKRGIKAIFALLVIGCLREWLAAASLFGYSFSFTAVGTTFGRSTNGALGVGGVLAAALVLWLGGLSAPITRVSMPSKRALLSLAVFTAAVGVVLSFWQQTAAPSAVHCWVFIVRAFFCVDTRPPTAVAHRLRPFNTRHRRHVWGRCRVGVRRHRFGLQSSATRPSPTSFFRNTALSHTWRGNPCRSQCRRLRG